MTTATPITLQIQRVLTATPEKVFAAWTDPTALKSWWGPKNVDCVSAEIDLCTGGIYKIENLLPDKSIVTISGEFEVIRRPERLVYTWTVDARPDSVERVTVEFATHPQGTELTLIHERIDSKAARDQHHQGWVGCLSGLHTYLNE